MEEIAENLVENASAPSERTKQACRRNLWWGQGPRGRACSAPDDEEGAGAEECAAEAAGIPGAAAAAAAAAGAEAAAAAGGAPAPRALEGGADEAGAEREGSTEAAAEKSAAPEGKTLARALTPVEEEGGAPEEPGASGAGGALETPPAAERRSPEALAAGVDTALGCLAGAPEALAVGEEGAPC